MVEVRTFIFSSELSYLCLSPGQIRSRSDLKINHSETARALTSLLNLQTLVFPSRL